MNPSIQLQVLEVLQRFDRLVAAKDMQVLAEFAPGEDVLLVGSEAGEVSAGRQALEVFFQRVYARPVTFSWEWDRIEAAHSARLAWFFAEGRVILTEGEHRRSGPYRISGVLEQVDGRWLWRQYHGSEPAAA